MRIGLGIAPPFDIPRPLDVLSSLVTQAEADGFAAVWAPSLPSVGPPDALVLLAALGPVTSRIELGSYVVPTFPRHPAMLAQQALTVQQLSANRLTLGIGLSHKPVIESGFGLDFSHPIRHLSEYLTVLMPLLAGQAVQVSGRDYRVQQPPGVPSGIAPPPVLVAALQPQMLRLAGELADGTALGAAGPRYIETMAVPHITEAARGRPARPTGGGVVPASTNSAGSEYVHSASRTSGIVYTPRLSDHCRSGSPRSISPPVSWPDETPRSCRCRHRPASRWTC